MTSDSKTAELFWTEP